jgi:hypothetical protein
VISSAKWRNSYQYIESFAYVFSWKLFIFDQFFDSIDKLFKNFTAHCIFVDIRNLWINFEKPQQIIILELPLILHCLHYLMNQLIIQLIRPMPHFIIRAQYFNKVVRDELVNFSQNYPFKPFKNLCVLNVQISDRVNSKGDASSSHAWTFGFYFVD